MFIHSQLTTAVGAAMNFGPFLRAFFHCTLRKCSAAEKRRRRRTLLFGGWRIRLQSIEQRTRRMRSRQVGTQSSRIVGGWEGGRSKGSIEKNATKNEDHSLESLINKNKGQLHLAVLPSSILLRSKHSFFLFFLYRINQQRSSKQAWKAAMAGLYKHFMHFFLPALSIGCVCVCVSFKEEQLQEGILFKMSRIMVPPIESLQISKVVSVSSSLVGCYNLQPNF
jgi:hypothetical protein